MLALGACSKYGQLMKNPDVDERYKGAMQYFKKKDYYHAGMLLEETLPVLKGSARADTAQLYYAYCQFYEKQFSLAAFYFKTFYETFPRSSFAEEASYMEGLSYYEDSPRFDLDQESTNEAIRVVQSFLSQYPETERKEDCNFIIESLRAKLDLKAFENAYIYYKKRNYQAALIALENYRKEFPESKKTEFTASLRVQSAYELALSSVASKQEERFRQFMGLYETFLDKFATSKYLPALERSYTAAQAWLADNKKQKSGQGATTSASID